MHLRLEQQPDRATLRALHLAAFGDHGQVVADLVDALRPAATGDVGLSLVAEDPDGDVVGHVMFTRSLLDAPRRLVEVQVLSPVAVRPGRQRQGIGGALIRAGLDTMVERSVPVFFWRAIPATTRAWASPAALGRASASRRCASPTPPSRRSGSPPTSRDDRHARVPGDLLAGTTRSGCAMQTRDGEQLP